MSKTRKHKKHRTKDSFARKKHKTIRHKLIFPNSTPKQIRKISNKINVSIIKHLIALINDRLARDILDQLARDDFPGFKEVYDEYYSDAKEKKIQARIATFL